MNNNNTNAVSGSMTDMVAPSEADMAQRMQALAQTTSSGQQTTTSTATSSYVASLANGMATPTGENQSQK